MGTITAGEYYETLQAGGIAPRTMGAYRLPSIERIEREHITKSDLARRVYPGVTFDCALPQEWIDNIAAFAKRITGESHYDELLSCIVWLYPAGNHFGYAAPLTREAWEWIRLFAAFVADNPRQWENALKSGR